MRSDILQQIVADTESALHIISAVAKLDDVYKDKSLRYPNGIRVRLQAFVDKKDEETSKNLMAALRHARNVNKSRRYINQLEVDSGSIEAMSYSPISETFLSHHLVSAIKRIKIFLDIPLDADDISPPLVPGEKLAPIMVRVEKNVIVLTNKKTLTGKIDHESAGNLMKALHYDFKALIEDLSIGSNLDQRFMRTCRRFISYLDEPLEAVSIHSLGLNCQLVRVLVDNYSDEMSSIAATEFRHLLTATEVFLNQFKEWQDYMHEFKKSDINIADSLGLIKEGAELIKRMEVYDTPIESKIIDRFKDMVEPVLSGLIEADAVAVPLAGSMSNLFSLMSQVALQNIHNINTFDGKIAVFGAAAILLEFSIETIKHFCPTLSQYQPFKFMIDVMSYIVKFYPNIKDISKGNS